jgi:hypothetical protein
MTEPEPYNIRLFNRAATRSSSPYHPIRVQSRSCQSRQFGIGT